jgi:hypothetical protein
MQAKFKALVKRVCGERLLGIVDYYRPRSYPASPFNAQAFRQRLFEQIVQRIPFGAIVETGTFRGDTTKYLHDTTGLPVYSVELSPRHYGYARYRFFGHRRISVAQGDSRSFLQRLVQRPELAQRRLFFYLDAHWYSDLPLREEVEIIFTHWPAAVVLIDDFQVPGDAGYRFDDYGEGKVLSLEYLARPDLSAFFPAEPSAKESGARRGCVVLANDVQQVATLRCCDTLVFYQPAGQAPHA